MTMTVIPAARPHLRFPGLSVRGLSKRIYGLDVVRDFDLVLSPGLVHGIYGEPGAGKTTLARLLCGFLVADSGMIAVDGIPFGAMPGLSALRLGIGARGARVLVRDEPRDWAIERRDDRAVLVLSSNLAELAAVCDSVSSI